MPLYLVERILPGATLDAVAAIQRAATEMCRAVAADGTTVRYLRSTFTPGESRCRCLFEAADAEAVQAVNEVAQLDYSRIVLAVELVLGAPTHRPQAP